jgi:2-methylcitrate dehydratase PrpD
VKKVDVISFIKETKFEHLPAEAVEGAKRCLLDCIGAMNVGLSQEPIKELFANVIRYSPEVECGASDRWELYVHIQASTYFDIDDGHRKAQGHPGGVIIPTVLQYARKKKLSLADVYTSIVIGYEVAVKTAVRMRLSGGPRKGSGAWSAAGAVAALAHLMKLNEQQISNALGFCDYYSFQAPQDYSLAAPSEMKEGMAYAGVMARQCIEQAIFGMSAMKPLLLLESFTLEYEITQCYFKMYSCCRFAHPVIEALSSVRDSFDLESVESIDVYSFDKAVLLSRVSINNPIEAMYSIPYSVSVWLLDGEVNPEHMLSHHYERQDCYTLASKISIIEDASITERFPLECLARVSVSLVGGGAIETPVFAAKGDPQSAYSKEELIFKFKRLSLSLGDEFIERTVSTIFSDKHPRSQLVGEL